MIIHPLLVILNAIILLASYIAFGLGGLIFVSVLLFVLLQVTPPWRM